MTTPVDDKDKKAAVKWAEEEFLARRGFEPDAFTWKDGQYGKELMSYTAAFRAGILHERTRPLPSAAEREKLRDVEDLIEEWGNELDATGQPRLLGMAPGFRKGWDACLEKVVKPLEAQLSEAQEANAALRGQLSDAKKLEGVLKAKLSEAVKALEYVEHRTNPNITYPKDLHPHGYIRSTRMRAVVVDALAKIKGTEKP